jgi:hypothetical protein
MADNPVCERRIIELDRIARELREIACGDIHMDAGHVARSRDIDRFDRRVCVWRMQNFSEKRILRYFTADIRCLSSAARVGL